MDPAFMAQTFLTLVAGVPLTLKLAFLSIALGAVIALILALMRLSGGAFLDWIARIYVFVFRGTPLLVQIFLIVARHIVGAAAEGTWAFVTRRQQPAGRNRAVVLCAKEEGYPAGNVLKATLTWK